MSQSLDILFIGDVVGRPGRDAAARVLERLRKDGPPDLVVANGENAAGGFGVTKDVFHELTDAGIDVVTLGNHAWDKREVLEFIGQTDRLIRPLNFPDGTPGRGWTVTTAKGVPVGVANVMGRALMGQALDCPFRALDTALLDLRAESRVILVDVHAETTAEKRALAWHVDGRVSILVGTHTHVQTADEAIMPGGTAFLTDAGMTGPYESVIGMKTAPAVRRMLTQLPERLEVADGPVQFNGVRVRVEAATGRAIAIERLNYRDC